MSSQLRLNTSVDQDQLQFLLAQQEQIQAQIASLTSGSSSLSSSFPTHRSPIYKQQTQRRHNVPRSMSSSGTSMARHPSSDGIEAPVISRAMSQQSEPVMMRTSSMGSTSAHSGRLPFTQNGAMPPPLQSDLRRCNPAFEAWVNQDQPYSSYTFSHQTSAPLQRSMPQRKPELEQVLEDPQQGFENPGDFLLRTGFAGVSPTPVFSITPSPVTMHSSMPMQQRQSRQSFNVPSTPTTATLTDATTYTSNMSRQNSLFNEPLVESIEMMKFNSNNSFSTGINNDDPVYPAAPQYSSPHHIRRSSDEEQTQLLVGAGGVGNDSQFSLSFPSTEAFAQSQISPSFGAKMEKSQSVESVSSTMTSSSRNKQRLQVSNMAAARPLMPKGGYEDNSMSRVNSSQSMTRLDSKDGSNDKVAIEKRAYQRPKHERVFCKLCDEHPDGFRGEHELRRHCDRQHKRMVKKWVCIEPPSGQGREKPVLPLSKCKACSTQKKKYGAYYNAAAHLRRAHFKPKAKGRNKSSKVDDSQKRGGKAGGDWPPMSELKNWFKEVEEPAADYTQQEEDDDEEDMNEHMLNDLSPVINAPTNFENTSDGPSMLGLYPTANTQNFVSNITFDNSMQHDIDLSMNFAGQTNFDFSSFPMNDPSVAFFDTTSSLPQVFDDPSLVGVNAVNFPYDSSLSFN
ncbi:4c868002-c3a2-40c9-8873-7b25acb54c67 [Sclerotinia trifoliorum]|uniref:4c868002-c3a2-40c9-8873-7b25acb54c67 n=1 Tax=Sclerotinia trifoliorum TaxID=28548 RepID=A0A8H2VPZ0_9HELO|nr:4c868002-c3a2-40c9-8873-7b25acb54c67 [Sclerotinia trifoliorum]